ncbi:hypothetical protein B0H14DRAFT_3895554 [Mycena olivaceomarginata]|nr:hypothetical protein B0H14DRAFT_3895554 [Mycena olivaceomarginata]
MLAVPLLLIPFVCGVHAANNLDVACKGECSYEIPGDTVSGTLKVSGASNAVSDITAAAGWTILNCDAEALAQDIRLACQTADCEHLFEGHGAIDTLIRLPQTCGANAFARVADIRVDPDQTLPSEVAATISPTGNITSMIFILSVDTNFAAIDSTKTGPVRFSLEGYNFPVANITPSTSPTRRDARGLKTRNWTAFNDTNSFDLPALHIDETFPLLGASVDCDDFSASVSANLATKVDATVSIGLIASGTVIPPVIDEVAVFAGIDGGILGTLDLTSSASGTVSTGKISLYSVALAGIDFPGLFTLGPTFGIYGELDATLDDADFDLSVDLAYNLNTKAFFPPETETSSGASTPADSTLVFSAVPDLTLNGKVEPKLIPELKLGLEAFSLISAAVLLDIEGSLSATFAINGSGTADAGHGTTAAASGQVDNACVDIGAAVSVNLEAEDSIGLLGIADSAAYTIWADTWELYNKCAEAEGSTKRDLEAAVPVSLGIARRAGITCPTTASTVASIEKIIDEIISDIKSSSS